MESVRQMLQAVQVVHDADIVHTDLKPANFVLVKGNLKLIDFGIAKAIPNDTTNIARDSQIGTANYMSPEALSDSGLGHNGRLMKMGRATDVWALGCILYQMVYGHTPYSKIRPMHLKIMAIQNPAHVIDFPPAAVPVNERGEPLEHLQVPVGQDLERVMRGCLRFEPKRRMTIPDLLLDPFLTGTAAASPAPVEDGPFSRFSRCRPSLMGGSGRRHAQAQPGRDDLSRLPDRPVVGDETSAADQGATGALRRGTSPPSPSSSLLSADDDGAATRPLHPRIPVNPFGPFFGRLVWPVVEHHRGP